MISFVIGYTFQTYFRCTRFYKYVALYESALYQDSFCLLATVFFCQGHFDECLVILVIANAKGWYAGGRGKKAKRRKFSEVIGLHSSARCNV